MPVRLYKNPQNQLAEIQCPHCQSRSWYKQKVSGVYVCRRCGTEYENVDDEEGTT